MGRLSCRAGRNSPIVETPMSSAFLVGNPFVETHPARLYRALFTLGVLCMPLATLMALATVLVRFRQRRGRERQQIKWLLAGVVFMALMRLPRVTRWNWRR